MFVSGTGLVGVDAHLCMPSCLRFIYSWKRFPLLHVDYLLYMNELQKWMKPWRTSLIDNFTKAAVCRRREWTENVRNWWVRPSNSRIVLVKQKKLCSICAQSAHVKIWCVLWVWTGLFSTSRRPIEQGCRAPRLFRRPVQPSPPPPQEGENPLGVRGATVTITMAFWSSSASTASCNGPSVGVGNHWSRHFLHTQICQLHYSSWLLRFRVTFHV